MTTKRNMPKFRLGQWLAVGLVTGLLVLGAAPGGGPRIEGAAQEFAADREADARPSHAAWQGDPSLLGLTVGADADPGGELPTF